MSTKIYKNIAEYGLQGRKKMERRGLTEVLYVTS
jgi:hypothetical protein